MFWYSMQYCHLMEIPCLGDDYCRVTIWDVDTTHYLNEPKDLIRCKAVYKPEISAEDKLKATIGFAI